MSRLLYLLDTNIVSYALRGEGDVEKRLRQHRPSEVGVSAITVAELRFGADKRGSRKLHHLLTQIFKTLPQLPFDATVATRYGKLAADLASRGEPIGMADTMIAAHALSLNVTLVTHNTRHFERVEGLKIEDWR